MSKEIVLLIYYGMILMSSIFAGLSQKFAKKENEKILVLNKPCIIVSCMLLLLLIGFRAYGVGVDDYAYKKNFENVAKNGVINHFIDTGMEPGYLLLNYIISLFTDNFQVVIFFTTLIPVILYYKALIYEKNNINLFLAVFLFETVLCLYFLRYNKIIYCK